MTAPSLSLHALPGIPMVQPGDDLAGLIGDGLARAGLTPQAGDVFVLAQKIVSKSEGRTVLLDTVTPGPEAEELGARIGKDPRIVQAILGEAVRVVRARPGLLIVEHKLGFVMANAGVDQSNVDGRDGQARVLLLPEDPDGSAQAIRTQLTARFGVPLAVVINDSFGRAWRRGTAGIALGVAGLPAGVDLRGTPDLFGRRRKAPPRRWCAQRRRICSGDRAGAFRRGGWCQAGAGPQPRGSGGGSADRRQYRR